MIRLVVSLKEDRVGRILWSDCDTEGGTGNPELPWPDGVKMNPPFAGRVQLNEAAIDQTTRDPRARRKITRDTPMSAVARASIQGRVLPAQYEHVDLAWEQDMNLNPAQQTQLAQGTVLTFNTKGQINAALKDRPALAGVRPGRPRRADSR